MTALGGNKIFAGDVNDAYGVYVTGAAEPTNNTVTLSNDLVLTIPTTGTYALDGDYFFRSPAAAGFKFNLIGDGSGIVSSNIRWGVEGNTAMVFGNSPLSITVSGANSFYRARLSAIFAGTAGGTLTVQYAQTTANAGPTGPIANRWIRAHLI